MNVSKRSIKLRMLVILVVAVATCCNAGSLGETQEQPQQEPAETSEEIPAPPNADVAEDQQEFEDAEERLPLTQAELSEAIKDLYTRTTVVLPAEKALELLQAVDLSYEKFAKRLPAEVDSRRLIQFSQEIDDHCGDERFYEDMIKAETLIKSKHRGLEQYITECIRSYQEVCFDEAIIVEQLTTFKEAHREGWFLLGEMQKKIETYKGERIVNDDDAVILALKEVLHAQENGMYKKSSKVLETCPSLTKLGSSLHSETLDPSWLSKDEIKNFPELVKVCHRLERSNYGGHISAELQYNAGAW